ncbi:adenosine receptor A2a-like [Oculina patagonica]
MRIKEVLHLHLLTLQLETYICFLKGNMSRLVFIVFCVLLSTESIFICIGNAFTIFVFWQKRFRLQRAYYLLLNLTVADLLVGVVGLISLATRSVPFLFTEPSNGRNTYHYSYLLSSLTILFSITSVFSLAVISLERVYAVLWPLRHRTLNTRVYFGGIAFVWAAGICVAALFLLPFYKQVVDSRPSTIAVNITFLLSLSVICASYMIIRNRLNRTLHIFDSQSRRNIERNIKLSKTLFIVVGLSLICWLPAVLLYTVIHTCPDCILEVATVMLTVTALHQANSVINPIVYSYRMPMFKEALRTLFRARGHGENVQVELAQF